ncbi:hypothetical protein FDUTEX481_03310 [Tolypothrix sp. PCC 7601]|nr:hypothetical protein FDUTEX481_03310 [Tolypothrix sp. PCC 7601]
MIIIVQTGNSNEDEGDKGDEEDEEDEGDGDKEINFHYQLPITHYLITNDK